jgi:enoyl-[acyl-carrier protein] reductase II
VKSTRVSELLSIDYPLLQGGMLWLADAGLAAAVSNAGALGVLSPLAGMERHGDRVKNLQVQIHRIRELTSRPFGVNVPLDLPQSGELIETVVTEEVPVVVTAAGNPRHFTGWLRQSGTTILHVVSSVRQARNAADTGVDAIIVEGIEAGGHNGVDEIPLFALLPQVADAVSLPIIAAGGIADARGWVAARALGAEGVQLGTRFLATTECIAHPRLKQAIVDANDTDTVVACRALVPTRMLKADLSQQLVEFERAGVSGEVLQEFLGYGRAREASLEGDLVDGEPHCGAAAGLIKEILPVAEVVRQMVEGYESIRRRVFDLAGHGTDHAA